MRRFLAGIFLSIFIIGFSVIGASAEESEGAKPQQSDSLITNVSGPNTIPPIVKPFSEELPPGN